MESDHITLQVTFLSEDNEVDNKINEYKQKLINFAEEEIDRRMNSLKALYQQLLDLKD